MVIWTVCSEGHNWSFILPISSIRTLILRFKVLTAVLLKIQVFWVMTLCHWVNGSWHFKRFIFRHPAVQKASWTACNVVTASGTRRPESSILTFVCHSWNTATCIMWVSVRTIKICMLTELALMIPGERQKRQREVWIRVVVQFTDTRCVGMNRREMWQMCGREEMRVGFWWGDMKRQDHLEELVIGGRILLKWILN